MENTVWTVDFMTIPCIVLKLISFDSQELSMAKKQYSCYVFGFIEE